MKFSAFLLAAAISGLAGSVSAQNANEQDTKRKLVGFGWLFSDDLIGDDHDRWRTAALTFSWILAPDWKGAPPVSFGEVIEIRAYTEMISSENIVNPSPTDRPYAGILGFGAYTYFRRNTIDYALGAELVAVGPQTHVDSLQSSFHNLIGNIPPSGQELQQQIPNGFYPTVIAEAARDFALTPHISLRPFGEARIGDESLVRIGADLTIGRVGRSELLVRDKGTGQRYRTMKSGPTGFSFILGADVAYVADSVYLPESRGLTIENPRTRFRIGGHWQGNRASVFYGATYLGREFTAQPESQVVGSLNFKIHF